LIGKEKIFYLSKRYITPLLIILIIICFFFLVFFLGHIFPNLDESLRILIVSTPFLIIYISRRKEEEEDKVIKHHLEHDLFLFLSYIKGIPKGKEQKEKVFGPLAYSPSVRKLRMKNGLTTFERFVKDLRNYDKQYLTEYEIYHWGPDNNRISIGGYNFRDEDIKAWDGKKEVDLEVAISNILRKFKIKIE